MIMNKQILKIAIPSIVSNITVPLCAMVDTIIVGHLGDAAYIGAIAVGGLLFNMAYWLFGFLRMGTSGLTAQAFGEKDEARTLHVLLRSLTLAFVISFFLIVLQKPLLHTAFLFIKATPEVRDYASIYYNVLIWGAPAVLSTYSLMGWFLGTQNARLPMIIAITQNVVNILASIFFVFVLRLKVEGVALGTLVAQYVGVALALVIGCRKYRWGMSRVEWGSVYRRAELMRFLHVNRDIFFRTLCIIAVTTYFTSAGSAQGEMVLAANTLLMQFFIIFSYFMDGFAYAGEAIGGRCYGEKSIERFSRLTKALFGWGGGTALVFLLIYVTTGKGLLHVFTDNPQVVLQAEEYLPFVWGIPVVSFAAFLLDGLYIGTTSTRQMLVSILISTIVFFVVVLLFDMRNDMLWMAFLLYLGSRGMMQFVLFKNVKKKFSV